MKIVSRKNLSEYHLIDTPLSHEASMLEARVHGSLISVQQN